MSEYGVLQGGRSRRDVRRRRGSAGLRPPRRRRSPRGPQRHSSRRIAEAALGLVVLGVALLVVLASGLASGTGGSPRSRAILDRPARRAHFSAHALQVSVYARTPDPVAQVPHPNLLGLPLRSGLLFDVSTGQVLWSKSPNAQLPIASLTKLMTAYLTVTRTDPHTARVLITKQAKNFTGSGVGLLPLGKRVPEMALLYGLLLPSGNDAAIALAQHVAGTQSRFIALMNATARRLGLTCTHYTTVDGVIDTGNHSCAIDLATLAHDVLQQPVLKRIVASPQAAIPFPIKGGKLYLTNNNPLLLSDFPGTDGVKTGFTTKAGLCLVATVRRGRTWLGVVLLHSGNWQTQAESILDAGFRALAAASRHAAPTAPPGVS